MADVLEVQPGVGSCLECDAPTSGPCISLQNGEPLARGHNWKRTEGAARGADCGDEDNNGVHHFTAQANCYGCPAYFLLTKEEIQWVMERRGYRLEPLPEEGAMPSG